MTHRGPDDEGYWCSERASIGMRRLSIIDLTGGHQPYMNADGSILAVFNGEIYNHVALRAKLQASGRTLASHADGEVIVHLYELDPEGFMHELDGMFAFAIVDLRRERVALVRDRWGKKPLLYTQFDGTLSFASEMRALLADPALRAEPDSDAVDAYLTLGYVPTPMTAVAGVHQLPPGSILEADFDGRILGIRRWWSPLPLIDESLTLEQAVKRTESLLLAAVSKRLASDRPLGVFLSGGVDSSLVAAAAVRVSSEPVHTFSIGFDNPAYDETRYAEQVAGELGTIHTTYRAETIIGDTLSELAEILDQPFADSSIVPTHVLARLAREQVVVALGGDGGDELFGGYVRYRAVPALQRTQRVPAAFALGRGLHRPLALALGQRRADRLHGAMTSYPSLLDRYLATMALDPQLVSAAAREGFAQAWQAAASTDERHRPRLVDLGTYLPGDLLFKADIASMASGLELRSPLLDQDISAFALSLPPALLYSDGGKPVLKALASKWIPGFDATRPKLGFGIPPELLPLASTAADGSTSAAQQWAHVRLEQWRQRWITSRTSEHIT